MFRKEDMAIHSSILACRIPMARGAWRATVHRVAQSQTWLNKHAGKVMTHHVFQLCLWSHPVDQQTLYKTPAELDLQTHGRWRVKHPYPTLGSLISETQQDSVPEKIENVCCRSSQGWVERPWHCDQARSLWVTPNRDGVQWSLPSSSPLWTMLSYLFSMNSRCCLVTKSWPALCWPNRL